MATFALVHGAWHGGWCWEPLTPLLQQAGHGVVAPDLPCDDASAATFDAYADVVCAALDGCEGDVVVVGHSLGGPTATLVAARRPASHLVYLCAVVPEPGRSLVDQWQAQSDMINPDWHTGLGWPDEQLRLTWTDRDIARSLLYTDCDDRTVQFAFDRLRPQASNPFTAACPLSGYPCAPCTSVVCVDDQLVSPAWSKRMARHVGATIVELPGGHSPELSRPAAVAEVLITSTLG